MTTQSLSQTISLRHQLSLNDLLRIAPSLANALAPAMPAIRAGVAGVRKSTDAEYGFWVTFAFGSAQAVILFGLIYAYFSH
ncbi:MAG: hypothetical protein HY301_13445 [Verrucomicrobia bacterium]|nr:hypothetical protein [Verrucomicrobiota bacterium]